MLEPSRVTMGFLLRFLIAALFVAWAGSAGATTVVSHQRPPDALTLGGTTVRPADLIDVDAAALVFDAFGTNPTFEDVDAAHHLSDGRILLSTVTSATLDGEAFSPGDLILYDATAPDMDKTELFFDASSIFVDPLENIDAVYLFESGPNAGSILLSTASPAEIGTFSFGRGDVIMTNTTDSTGASSSMFFNGESLISGTAFQKDVDAVHLLSGGNLWLSVSQSNGSLAGVTLREQDIVAYDPNGDPSPTAMVFLDGDLLFDGTTADLNAVTMVPEPGTLLLVAVGLGALGVARSRR